MCGTDSIRDVIAFPKTIEGKDLMSGAPVAISEEEKQRYHIQTVTEAPMEQDMDCNEARQWSLNIIDYFHIVSTNTVETGYSDISYCDLLSIAQIFCGTN